MSDNVNHPSHYTTGGVEDLEKARVYLDWMIDAEKEIKDGNHEI